MPKLFTGAWAFRLGFEDAEQISDYAYEAVCWLSMQGIMGATEGNRFAPQAAVSAAEADEILAAAGWAARKLPIRM